MDRVPERILLGHFVNGLKEKIIAEVMLLSPLNLDQAMDFAVRVEDKNRALQWRKIGSNLSKTGNSPSHSFFSYQNVSGIGSVGNKGWGSDASETQSSVSFAKSASVSSPTRNLGEVKRLTDKELQEKRSKGLCFRCDEKWSIGHRCKKKRTKSFIDG